MDVKVVVRLTSGDVHKHTVPSHKVWMTDGFLHVKEDKKTYSYSNVCIFLIEQEEVDESS